MNHSSRRLSGYVRAMQNRVPLSTSHSSHVGLRSRTQSKCVVLFSFDHQCDILTAVNRGLTLLVDFIVVIFWRKRNHGDSNLGTVCVATVVYLPSRMRSKQSHIIGNNVLMSSPCVYGLIVTGRLHKPLWRFTVIAVLFFYWWNYLYKPELVGRVGNLFWMSVILQWT